MRKPTDFFQVGGTLSEDAPSYIERPADKELLAVLEQGELCLVLAPRQTGKSSLMVHAVVRLREDEVRGGIVDLQLLGSQKDPDRWFGAVVNQIERSLKLKINSIEWWKAHNQLDVTQRFTNFLEDVVLAEAQGDVVLFFDEIDSVLSLPFSDDFFTTIRSIFNARATNPTLKRLNFVLLGFAIASSFIRDSSRLSFNVGRTISLDDFDKESTEPFQQVLGPGSDSLIDRIFYWTNGQPYLVQKLSAAACSWSLEQHRAEQIDEEVKRSYLQRRIEQDTHLKFIQDYLLADSANAQQILLAYRQVLRGEEVAEDESLVQSRLKLSGIVRVEDKKLALRNHLYESIFNQQWVQKQGMQCLFLSYARKDSKAVISVDQWLRNKGAEVILDDRNFVAGESLRDEVLRWIQQADVVVCFISKNSRHRPYPKLEREIAETMRGKGEVQVIYFNLDNTILDAIHEGRLYIPGHDLSFEEACEKLWQGIVKKVQQPRAIDLEPLKQAGKDWTKI